MKPRVDAAIARDLLFEGLHMATALENYALLDVEEADAGVLDTRCPRVCEASEDAVSNSLQLCLKCSWQAYARSGGRQHMICCAAITQGLVLGRFPVEVQLVNIAAMLACPQG